MKRETTNKIRFLMEDCLPPILRDTALFRWVMELGFGPSVAELARFRRRATELSAEEYAALYARHPRVHEDTDNSQAMLARIEKDVEGRDICDVGCGTGYTLRYLAERKPHLRLTGVDILIGEDIRRRLPEIAFREAPAEHLPFPDRSFDTVLCTHTLEHILDLRQAVKELRRMCRKRLILVVPREREALYTFNPHFHFFPYPHSFLRALIPLPPHYTCEDIGRDLYYSEEAAAAEKTRADAPDSAPYLE